MADYEKVIREQLKLQPLSLPNALLKPLQVHIFRDGRAFGRFKLQDVFSGDFDINVGEPGAIADLKKTLSDSMSISGSASAAGPGHQLHSAKGALEAKRAKRFVLTGMEATLQECDQGQLHYAMANAVPYEASPLQRSDIGYIVIAVAAFTNFSLELETELGAKIDADATLAGEVTAKIGAAAQHSSDGGLMVSYSAPIPFAARVWSVKRKVFGGLKITTPSGVVGLLGDGPDGGTHDTFGTLDLFGD